ncbi:MAG: ABC transporter substrate-binding protein [Burkholderiales bacterium]|nr:ABC transporter substrate-binding protein [Burkholderiales bacterium]
MPSRRPPRLALTLALTLAAGAAAAAEQPFVFLTNWYAEAEHGGFYQAQAEGLYKQAGLAVTLRMGGPQVNGLQLLAAGQVDCFMGYDVQTMKAHEAGVAAVTVAAAFQKDPQVMIGHPETFRRLEDLKGKTILISSDTHTNFWPWLRERYGLSDSQTRPYTFNIQPFIADRNIVQQGYLSSEPYAIEKMAHFKPTALLLSDAGWPPYTTTIVCMADTLKKKPAAVAAFVRASMHGWKDYLEGDPSAANAMIRKDNPAMGDDELRNGIRLLKETGIVLGGDAAKYGIGIVTDARMKATYEMMVRMKLLDPAKVKLADTYTTRFVEHLKVMP